ncbi:MAG: PHP domain-containing protein [Desulfobacterales bacterium]|nr:PHP domain-containing protein [Desulfobacterales bacterium]
MAVDLHIHTTASDGSSSPCEVVESALKIGLTAIAVTDHDTVDGVRDILTRGTPRSLSFLPGVEISSTPPDPFHSKGSFHILGYGVDIASPPLVQALEDLRLEREMRNPKMVEKLQGLGIDISLEEVRAEALGQVVGRPHMAAVLVRKKVVNSTAEAFGRYLAKGASAFVEKGRIGCENAISLIRAAGGVPVLAHPVTIGAQRSELKALLSTLASLGLAGLEAYYSTHTRVFTREMLELAGTLGLFVTGGSDYHGAFKPDIQLGVGRGDLHVPDDCYATLIDALP